MEKTLLCSGHIIPQKLAALGLNNNFKNSNDSYAPGTTPCSANTCMAFKKLYIN